MDEVSELGASAIALCSKTLRVLRPELFFPSLHVPPHTASHTDIYSMLGAPAAALRRTYVYMLCWKLVGGWSST